MASALAVSPFVRLVISVLIRPASVLIKAVRLVTAVLRLVCSVPCCVVFDEVSVSSAVCSATAFVLSAAMSWYDALAQFVPFNEATLADSDGIEGADAASMATTAAWAVVLTV